MCLEDGGIVDDLFTYKLAERHFLTVTNASNHAKDLAYFRAQADGFDVDVNDRADDFAMLAVQGPAARGIVGQLADGKLPGRFHCCTRTVAGVALLVCGTGYTGEDGVELLLDPARAEDVWDALVDAGVTPVGLGARDTLRLESRFSLYGNEIDETTNPIEAGLAWTCKLDKEFLGRDRIAKVKEAGPAKRIAGLVVTGGVARHGHPVAKDGAIVGVVTSGTFGPTVEKSIALAYVPAELAKVGTQVAARIREKDVPATVVKTPFYKRSEK
jgi:aminomethyltransferase